MYPSKNSPIAMCKRLNIPFDFIPFIDPNDELTVDVEQEVCLKYVQQLKTLKSYGLMDNMKNVRQLMKGQTLQSIIDQFFTPNTFEVNVGWVYLVFYCLFLSF